MNSRIPSNRASGTSASRLTQGLPGAAGEANPAAKEGQDVTPSPELSFLSVSDSFKGAPLHCSPVRHRGTGFVKAAASGKPGMSCLPRRLAGTGFSPARGVGFARFGSLARGCQEIKLLQPGFPREKAFDRK